MSQNSKTATKAPRLYSGLSSLLLLLLLFTFAERLSAQNLLQASTELSELLRSDAFVPKLRISTDQFTLQLDGTEVEINDPSQISLDNLGIYTLTFTQPPTREAHIVLLKLGNTLDTIRSTRSIQIFNQAGYLNWESLGASYNLSPGQASQLTCTGCSTQEETIQGKMIKTIRAEGNQRLTFDSITVAPFERLILQTGGENTIAQVRGGRNQITKPTQRLLEMWYQYIAYQDPNWQQISLAELRSDLASNPFLPDEIIQLIPNSPIQASTYLPPQKQPKLSNWQERLYRNKSPIEVSLQPKLQYEKLESPALPANQVASQQAQDVYAADERLGFSLSQERLLRGLASFIEERAQEELNVAFLGRMQRRLQKDSLLLTLFPNTAQLFEQFELDNYRFIMDNAKTVFTSDLSNLGLNVYQVFELEELKDDFKYSSELYFAALVLKMINMVYLDVPTDTILINSYLALENQADILSLQLRKNTAAALAQDSSLQQDIITTYQAYTNSLSQGVSALNTQISTLSSIITDLRENVPYTHPLYQQVWASSDELNNLRGQLRSWQQNFREKSILLENQLRGVPSADYILSNSQLTAYNRFFPDNAEAPIERISKGLGALDQQLRSLEVQQVRDWNSNAQYLGQTILELQSKWLLIQNARLPERAQRIFLAYQSLERALQAEIGWWAAGPERQRPLLALQFLENSLQQDSIVGLKYQNLQQFLLGDKTNFNLLKNDLPPLEEALKNTYWPLLKKNVSELKAGKDTLFAPAIQQNAATFRRALPGFRSLFEQKENTEDIDLLENYLDSLQGYFLSLPTAAIPGGQEKAFRNPYLPILDSLIRLSQFEQRELREKFASIEAGLDSLGQPVTRAAIIRSGLQQKILDFQATQPDSVLLKSGNRIRGLSKVFAVGNHLVQALRSESIQIQQRTVQDTFRIRNTYQVGSTQQSRTTVSDSLSIQALSQRDTIQQKWLSFDQLEATFKKDSLSRALFFGLLFEDIRHIPDLQMGLKGNRLQADNIANLSISILRGIEQLKTLENKRYDLKAKGEKLSLTDYSSLIFQTLSIVEQSFGLFKEQRSSTGQSSLLQSGQQILGQSNQLYQNLVNKQYNMAIANLAAMVQSIVVEQQSKQMDKTADQFKSKLLTYGSFMAAVATAQTPDQVKTALELASVEVGYSRVKRVNDWNIALNAYLGVGAGFERSATTNSGFQVNLATPIGLSVSKSIGRGHSLSVFGSLLDLGPIVTYDFNTKSTATEPDLGFEDFVAPGAFLFWNIANSPFTTGFGVQRTSQIRVIGDNPDPQRTTRIFGAFLIDIPIFNLYTKKN
ncbi:MAG TPA: hypothetical protein VJ953_02170 [Saprospiraceae bacterium]|nr:hypothetical protein [Saprospiraceae bacterium]